MASNCQDYWNYPTHNYQSFYDQNSQQQALNNYYAQQNPQYKQYPTPDVNYNQNRWNPSGYNYNFNQPHPELQDHPFNKGDPASYPQRINNDYAYEYNNQNYVCDSFSSPKSENQDKASTSSSPVACVNQEKPKSESPNADCSNLRKLLLKPRKEPHMDYFIPISRYYNFKEEAKVDDPSKPQNLPNVPYFVDNADLDEPNSPGKLWIDEGDQSFRKISDEENFKISPTHVVNSPTGLKAEEGVSNFKKNKDKSSSELADGPVYPWMKNSLKSEFYDNIYSILNLFKQVLKCLVVFHYR